MRTSTTNANEIKKHRLCYKILAAAVWILVWQLAAVAETGDPSASPVSVIKKAWAADCDRRFLEIYRIQLWQDRSWIYPGAGSWNFAGGTFLWVFCSGNSHGSADYSDQSHSGCLLYYPVPDLDSIQKFIRFYFLSYGFSSGLHQPSGGPAADG